MGLPPAEGSLGVAQPDGIVLDQEIGDGGTQVDRVEWLGCDEHQGLIPMVGIQEILLEEPVLNGRKGDHLIDTLFFPLFSSDHSSIGQGSQASYRGSLENMVWAQVKARLLSVYNELGGH